MKQPSQDAVTRTSDKLSELHHRLLGIVEHVDRVCCVLYDAPEDMLRTFVSSTLFGDDLTGYQTRLSESKSLSKLAAEGGFRLIANLPADLSHDGRHSSFLLNEGYHASLTVPMYHRGEFAGFIFLIRASKAQ